MSIETTPPAISSGENYSAYPKASPMDRVLAALIDGGIIFGGLFVLGILSCIPLLGCLVMPLYFLAAIAAMVYQFTKDALPFLGGQGYGKKLMKIRVVTETGDAITGNWGAAIVRTVVFLIPFFGIVETVLLFVDKDTLRFGDKWAKTKVVKVAK